MKIGIATFYHKSINCGGLLQAYALTAFLTKINPGDTKQICLVSDTFTKEFKSELPKYRQSKLWQLLKRVKNHRVKDKGFSSEGEKNIEKRQLLYAAFAKTIPHTVDEYTSIEQMKELNDMFDVFICGSDQIWNPNWFFDWFYLPFVRKEKLKISYAASMAVDNLTKEQADIIIPLINKFDYVSVRERTAKKLINSFVDKEVNVVCDPVMLLTADDWDIMAKPSNLHNYAYTYLLGHRSDNREITTSIANKLGLDLVTVPYIHMKHNSYDATFGDIRLNDVGPSEFVGLIRDSQVVVTDSFHAVVFSVIFQKKFFVLLRNKETETGSMNSRIIDLLNDLELSERIVTDISQLTDDFLAQDVDYSCAEVALKQNIITSATFLQNALQGTELAPILAQYISSL